MGGRVLKARHPYDAIRAGVVLVPADRLQALLPQRSVRENIALADPGMALEQVIGASALAGAHEFILELPQGYDTIIGERGASLSGGQCQRIAIARALLGNADTIIDLAVPVDAERDHVRGPDRAPVTLVEYGDFECPYCGRAEPVVRELMADYGDLRYVWRHLPLTDVHPHAQLAAEGAEAAAGQGKFWQMHDQLLDHQGALTGKDLIRYAGELGLDIDQFTRDLRNHAGQAKIAADVDSADLSGVSGTPTFFVNGKRHQGAYDISTLSDAVRTARTRILISSLRQPRRAS